MFGSRQLNILVHIADQCVIHPKSKKGRAVSSFPMSTNLKLVRRILRLCSFIRRFSANLGSIVGVLSNLSKEHTHFLCNAGQAAAFSLLNEVLTFVRSYVKSMSKLEPSFVLTPAKVPLELFRPTVYSEVNTSSV